MFAFGPGPAPWPPSPRVWGISMQVPLGWRFTPGRRDNIKYRQNKNLPSQAYIPQYIPNKLIAALIKQNVLHQSLLPLPLCRL